MGKIHNRIGTFSSAFGGLNIINGRVMQVDHAKYVILIISLEFLMQHVVVVVVVVVLVNFPTRGTADAPV